jgi:hypothetical protein
VGVSLEVGNRDALLPCLTRLVNGLPKLQREQLLEEMQVTLRLGSVPIDPACGLTRKRIASYAEKSWSEMDGAANRAGEWRIFKFITFNRAVCQGMMLMRVSSRCASDAISNSICEG